MPTATLEYIIGISAGLIFLLLGSITFFLKEMVKDVRNMKVNLAILTERNEQQDKILHWLDKRSQVLSEIESKVEVNKVKLEYLERGRKYGQA